MAFFISLAIKAMDKLTDNLLKVTYPVPLGYTLYHLSLGLMGPTGNEHEKFHSSGC